MADIKVPINSAQAQKIPAPAQKPAGGVASLITPQKPTQPKSTDGIKPQAPAAPASAPAPRKASDSPWDDAVPEAAPKTPTIIGSLHDQEPLSMPKNVEEKVGQKIPAQEFMSEETAKKEAELLSSTNSEEWDWFGGGSDQSKNQTLAAPIGAKINLGSAQIPQAATNPVVSQAAGQSQAVAVAQPATQAPPNPTMVAPAQNGGIFAAFSGIFRRKVPAAPNALPQVAPNAVVVTKVSGPKKVLLGIVGFLLLIAILTFMTEMGILSLGLEKAYGAVGLEKLWGGLPNDAEQALAYSFMSTKGHVNYKVKGTMTLRIDSSVKSEIVSPLVSVAEQDRLAMKDIDGGRGIPVAETASDTYVTIDPSSSSSSGAASNSNSSSATSPSTSSSNSSSASSAATSSSIPAVTNSTTESPAAKTTSASASTVTDLPTTISLKSGSSGTEAQITFKKDGSSEEVDLVNMGQNLYVKGNSDVNFGAADPNQFVKYQFQKLDDKQVGQDIFNIPNASGLVIKGERTGNEIAGGVRCYKYRLDSVDIGTAFQGIGITPDLIQTASGQVWIGVRDKTLRRVQLKITTPISSAVTMINLDITFSEYGIVNKLDHQDEIANAVVPSKTISAVKNLTGDEKRKADVDSIVAALAQYKTANGKYPVSSELLKLDSDNNIIKTALVPKYLAALPTDPTNGWYYAYKSADGTSCSLSARLENQSDSSGQLIGGVYLYLKYSN